MFRKYYRPKNLSEALAILSDYGGRARVMAGGTDLIVQLSRGDISFDAVVDITRIKELRYIIEEDGIKIGALATHTDLSESILIKQKAPYLAEAAGEVGSLQIRNVGTVGGNIVNAQPAADTAIPLMALNAVATIVSATGARQLPLEKLYHPDGGTMLDPTCELLTEISFHSPKDMGGNGAFGRVAKRKALALPVFNAAVVLLPSINKDGIKDARIVMGPVARFPFRAGKAEKLLEESPPEENIFREAAITASHEAQPRDSVFRGSSVYRKKLVQIIVYRNLIKAWKDMGY